MRPIWAKIRVVSIVQLVFWLFRCAVVAQELPFLRRVTIMATVQLQAGDAIYTYGYKIRNDSSSVGTVDRAQIDIATEKNSMLLDTTGLKFARPFIKLLFETNYPKLLGRAVPVGFPGLPPLWIGSMTEGAKVSFYGQSIEPGETLQGFAITSRGLPGIRSFSAEPRDISDLYPSPDEVSNPDSLARRIDEDREAVKFRDLTVAPVAPPTDFAPTIWLDTLISYKHQALSLGWITNQGIANSFDQKLENARKQLQRGNNKAAKNILDAFLNEVEAQKDKHLTSEAYALLKYNAEYLISKL